MDSPDKLRDQASGLGVRFIPHSKTAHVGYNAFPLLCKVLGWKAEQTWVTLYPEVWHPDSVKDPFAEFPRVVAHELVHCRQQRDTVLAWWMFRYATSQDFRWRMEREAYLTNIANGSDQISHVVADLATAYRISSPTRVEMREWFEAHR
jgi:hypothetical protein